MRTGERGEQGLRGETGERGPSGATNVAVRTSTVTTSPPDSSTTATAPCQPGERAVGGGFELGSGSLRDAVLVRSDASGGAPPAGWQVVIFNRDDNGNDAGDLNFQAEAVCASP